MRRIIIWLVIGASGAWAGQPSNQWHELVLDSSSQADAVRILGQPAKTGSGLPFLVPRDNYRDELGKATRLTSMSFRDVAGMKDVDLYFEGDVLVAIRMTPASRIEAATLPNVYGLSFRRPESPGEKIFKSAPMPTYYLEAQTSDGRVFTEIKTPLLRGNDRGDWPGGVIWIELLSHHLDRGAEKKGADLLR